MEEKESVRESEIDLRAVLQLLKRNLALLIVVTIIFGSGAFLYSKLFITKKYEATCKIIVNNLSASQTTANNAELLAAQDLADVYVIIMKSDIVLQEVIDDLNLSMSYEQLRSAVSVTSSNSVITVSIRDENADKAKEIIESIVEVAPPIIKDKVEAGSVNRLGDPKITNNGSPVSPNAKRNALIGALVGLVLALGFVFIKEFTNNTFKTEEDITDVLKIPVLGVIPAVETKEFNKNV